MNYSYLPEAKKEFSRHAAKYEKINANLGAIFYDEVIATIGRIIDHPLAWPKIDKEVRRCLIDQFP